MVSLTAEDRLEVEYLPPPDEDSPQLGTASEKAGDLAQRLPQMLAHPFRQALPTRRFDERGFHGGLVDRVGQVGHHIFDGLLVEQLGVRAAREQSTSHRPQAGVDIGVVVFHSSSGFTELARMAAIGPRKTPRARSSREAMVFTTMTRWSRVITSRPPRTKSCSWISAL